MKIWVVYKPDGEVIDVCKTGKLARYVRRLYAELGQELHIRTKTLKVKILEKK